jgi:hypothetical protein
LIKNVAFIGINLGLSGGVVLLTGVLVLLALLLAAAWRATTDRMQPRLLPIRVRSRRNVARPSVDFPASTPSRAPPFLSRRQTDDDLGDFSPRE